MNNEIKEMNLSEMLFNRDERLLDYITNLQEELEDLRESDWAWHQTLKIQNKREYRSKFLKEFQEEYGTNTFPDYDEIYKRYDKLKKENEKVHKELDYADNYNIYLISKIDKAIEHIKQHQLIFENQYEELSGFDNHLLDILNGDDE